MKKLLGIVVLGLLLSGSAYAEKRSWICNKIDKNISECNSNRISDSFKIKEIFVGETSNSLPSGNGKISFEVNGERVDDYAKGFFVLDKDNYLILHTGEQHVDNNIYYKKNKKLYKTQYYNGEVFEGTYYLKTINPKKGIFKSNKGDRYNGTFTKDGQYLNGIYHFKDGRKIKYKNSKTTLKTKEDKTNLYLTTYLSIITLVIIYILFRYFKKINVKKSNIIKRIKADLYNFGLRSKGDYNALIVVIIILGPGVLTILSWILSKLGSESLSNLLDIIFMPTGKLNFIVFIYVLLSTLAVSLIILVQILDKFNKTK
ncbi:hypothetical protein N9L67_00870 [Candidatus Pelagibacter bacterium]|nr:hypothetical protein [Candidatus Pelagibacter bacterium]